MSEQNISSLIVDWGTTNFRAFAISADGKVIDQVEHHLGLLQVKNGLFAEALQSVLEPWMPSYKSLPVFMAGMVGSLKGWVNVAYAETEAGVADLLNKAHKFSLPWGPAAYIVPGVCHRLNDNVYDVMRGEEIQLFGLAEKENKVDFHAMLPGTHNKHVQVSKGKITAFRSFLTGEMFSVVSEHMLIGRGLDKKELGKHTDAFIKGVEDGANTSQLSATLFQCWTHRLFKNLNEQEILDYLSGMLIGNELRALEAKHYYLVGGSSLCERYRQACAHLSVDTTIVNGNDCFIAGMNRLSREIKDGII